MRDVCWSMPYMDCTKCLGCSNIRGAYLFFFLGGEGWGGWYMVSMCFDTFLFDSTEFVNQKAMNCEENDGERGGHLIYTVCTQYIYIHIIYVYIMCSYLLIKMIQEFEDWWNAFKVSPFPTFFSAVNKTWGKGIEKRSPVSFGRLCQVHVKGFRFTYPAVKLQFWTSLIPEKIGFEKRKHRTSFHFFFWTKV